MRTMLLLLLAMTVSSFMDRDRFLATEATLRQLATCIADFQKTCGRLPTGKEGLDVLLHPPPNWPEGVPWTPYLEVSEIPRDAWGKDFMYLLDPELAEGFGVYSGGPDGVSFSNGNDRDDLNTWRRRRHHSVWYEYLRSKVDLQTGVVGLGLVLLAVAAVVVVVGGTIKAVTHS